MEYRLKINDPHKHFISFSIKVNVSELSSITLQLPAWRPGRYELGNFAKNIRNFNVLNIKRENLTFKKLTKDSWLVENIEKENFVFVEYEYFANTLNAGSTLLNEDQLYINPVNCFIYNPVNGDESCLVYLEIPKTFKTITSLKHNKDGAYIAKSFDELADSPIISSETIQQKTMKVSGTDFHFCFQGEIRPQWKKMLLDFEKFISYQIKCFGSFPFKDYYFLFQITPQSSYHGVEHHESTVILLGPSYDVFEKLYNEFLGVSSHELYHVWNIKAIRPEEMFPYDFSKENYTELGYVAEGVTTYMGDRILFESGVFSKAQYLNELIKLLKRHYHNDGRKNYSVADSSYDTWLDGYVAGVPSRKVSIYVEGALIAFICDAKIRKATNNRKSLHDVMSIMYSKEHKVSSYNKDKYKNILEEVSGVNFDDVFDKLIYGSEDFTPYIENAMESFGWSLKQINPMLTSHNHGLKISNLNGFSKVIGIIDSGAADVSGIAIGDVIHSLNGIRLSNDLENWLNYFKSDKMILSIEREGQLRRVELELPNNLRYFDYEIN
jgi:predicted metalloprotease with PDZ domain